MREQNQASPMTADMLVRMSKDLRKRPNLFHETLAGVRLIERDGRPFAVRFTDIPEPHQTAFVVALRGSGHLLIDGKDECAHVCD
ncbi:hypothetical protein [Caballeronia grimmiae]|uniref:AraC family transcriptional regulator n=1 Tax=Caballeronia grimmiae TaxID=1071679 RepID=A0ABQ1S9K5_9BURK|nr:hypothetical protein [Caballeronia grimmiae]GGD96776.1 hypothetical protein GCM10010985_59360 [Caballeronia grimmiae]